MATYKARAFSIFNDTNRDITFIMSQNSKDSKRLRLRVYKHSYSQPFTFTKNNFVNGEKITFISDEFADSTAIVDLDTFIYQEDGEAFIIRLSEISYTLVMSMFHNSFNFVQILNSSSSVPYYEGHVVVRDSNVTNRAIYNFPFYISRLVNENEFAEVNLTQAKLDDLTLVLFKAVITNLKESTTGRDIGETVGGIVGSIGGAVISYAGGTVAEVATVAAGVVGVPSISDLGSTVGTFIGKFIGTVIDENTKDPYANIVLANVPILYTSQGNRACQFVQYGTPENSQLILKTR
ncbi:MAG: hypothetical protein ACRCX2_00450 [Paraclostridium sp.]